MADETPPQERRLEHPSVRSEPSDASFSWVLGVIVVALVLAVVIHLGMVVFFSYSKNSLAEARQTQFPLSGKPSAALPPEPRLDQLDRMADIAQYSARQQARLDVLKGVGPTADKAYVRIPIERAMKLLADKLPARQSEENQQPRDNGLVNGGASNSGRLFNRRIP
jgi:hypothetical protein